MAKIWLPKRPKDAHKGSCGRILIVAGSRGMTGAAILCALGAMRAGAGLVRVATAKSQLVVLAKRAPWEVTLEGLPETSAGTLSKKAWPLLLKTIKAYRPTHLAVGPGLGQNADIRFLVEHLVQNTNIPLVLDADGLNAFKGRGKNLSRKGPLILTPHAGELGGLFGVTPQKIQAAREAYAKKASTRFKGVCLLKGAETLIAEGLKLWKNTTGNPGMASAGTGDVLTGMIAGLWGQMKSFEASRAACLGVYLHGLAGDFALKKTNTQSLMASDLIPGFNQAVRFVQFR